MQQEPQTLIRKIGKIAGINLGILVVYSVGLFIYGKTSSPSYAEFMVFMLLGMALHCVVCAVLSLVGFIQGRKDRGLAYLLAILAVALVGFSLCYGGMSLLPDLHHK